MERIPSTVLDKLMNIIDDIIYLAHRRRDPSRDSRYQFVNQILKMEEFVGQIPEKASDELLGIVDEIISMAHTRRVPSTRTKHLYVEQIVKIVELMAGSGHTTTITKRTLNPFRQ